MILKEDISLKINLSHINFIQNNRILFTKLYKTRLTQEICVLRSKESQNNKVTKIYYSIDFNKDLRQNMEIKIFNYQNSLTCSVRIQIQSLMIASNCPFRKNSSINHCLLIWSISPVYSVKMSRQVVQAHVLLALNSLFPSSSKIKS